MSVREGKDGEVVERSVDSVARGKGDRKGGIEAGPEKPMEIGSRKEGEG